MSDLCAPDHAEHALRARQAVIDSRLETLNHLVLDTRDALTSNQVFRTTADRLVDMGLHVCVFYLDEVRRRLVLGFRCPCSLPVTVRGTSPGKLPDRPLVPDDVPELATAVKERHPVYVGRWREPVRAGTKSRGLPGAVVDLPAQCHGSSAVLLPLTARGSVLGVLGVFGNDLSQADCSSVLALANIAALVLANVRLHDELRDREQQVSHLLKATIDAQEDERERICLEIHDGVAQTLAPAFQYLQALERHSELSAALRPSVRKAATLVRNAIREAREVIASLRPAALDTLGLVATLRYELDELQGQTGWHIEFDADQARFPKTVETALYRIVHEAVNNVAKHARASLVAVRITQAPDRIVAEIRDDGVGFDLASPSQPAGNGLEPDDHTATVPRRRRGVGLLSMRKRTELLNGRFDVSSTPGGGTRVRVEVPLLRQDD